MIGGWLDGHAVRKTRREFACHNPTCPSVIAVGTHYVEGHRVGRPRVNRYCLICQGTPYPETRGVVNPRLR